MKQSSRLNGLSSLNSDDKSLNDSHGTGDGVEVLTISGHTIL